MGTVFLDIMRKYRLQESEKMFDNNYYSGILATDL